MKFERAVIVGATGYSGEELVRLLGRHPRCELVAVTSRQHSGKTIGRLFPRFFQTRFGGIPVIESTVDSILATGAGTVFLALPHGVAAEFALPLFEAGCRVIDLSADFRIKDPAVYEEFYGSPPHAPALSALSVYGLAEIAGPAIRGARLIACPGCYPTSVLIPLVPLVRARLVKPGTICVSSMSGVSGAGRNAKLELIYPECNESLRAYSVPKHRHLAEIEQELTRAANEPVRINFTPHLVPVTRGIHTTIYVAPAEGVDGAAIGDAFRAAYADAPFVRLLGESGHPDTLNVTGTNFIDVAWRHDLRTGRIILLSAEDNLTKGAAGQAVQCYNIAQGWPETSGLD